MNKKGNMPKSKKSSLDMAIAKYGLVNSVLVAMLSLIGTGITAYFGYLGIRAQIDAPMMATQTAESKTIIVNPTSTPTTLIQITQTPVYSSPIQDYKIVYPGCDCDIYLSPNQKILIRLRWAGTTLDKAENGADFLKYSVTINGDDISNTVGDIKNYRKPAILVAEPVLDGDPSNAWWVYWDVPIGKLPSYKLTTIKVTREVLTAINTGWDTLPAGLTESFSAILHITVPKPTETAKP